ncbi:MAG TPA: phospholipid carrier-dependent glycosyltransferase, partial [Anaerolineae bacterium]|nr:phospholipid carrier-dependent glycosyltransferase [Anaerolineae bacterium]
MARLIDAEKTRRSNWIVALFIFVLAFVPRALSLNAISIIDEFQWQEGTQAFINGLLSGDFLSTYCRYHPAVTDMWLIAIGLGFKYLVMLLRGIYPAGFQAFLEQSAFPSYPNADFLVAERLPFALITSISVVLVYLLAKKLFGRPVAWLGAGLLALDPFYISHSRVVTPDGLLASFMTLSILSFIVYLICERSRYYVAFSGFAAGLAFLTKVPAVLLVPMAVVLTVMKHATRNTEHASRITHHVADLAIWGMVAFLTFFCLWPAMWVDPVGTVQRMVADMTADTGGGWNQFFMGRITKDPGLLFYPVVLLFRTTPLTLIGAAASLLFFSHASRITHHALLMLVICILLFTLFMSFGTTRFDRFLLPIFPSVDILAALGLYELAKAISARRGKPVKALTLLILIIQAGFALPQHPYFLSFYNPLVGGSAQAPKVLLIGWGEAFEQAAGYLNGKENATELKVAAQYPASFGPYFAGQTLAISRMYPTDIWPWLPADYIVFYINGAQRNVPDPGVVSYFRSLELEHTVRAKGLEYAWIYRGPQFILSEAPAPQYPAQADLAGKVLFLGYDLYGPAESDVKSGDTLQVITYWRCLEEMEENYSVYVRLVQRTKEDEAGHLWGQTDNWPAQGFLPTSQWREGMMARDKYSIEILAGTPPGDYHLEVGLYSVLGGGRTRVLGRWEAPQRTVRVVKPLTPPSVESLEIQNLLPKSLGGRVELLGYNLSPITFRPGDPLPLTLFWRAESDLDEDYFVLLQLQAEDGTGWTLHRERPADGSYPTTLWEQGEIVREQLDARIPADVPPGRYALMAGLTDAESGEEVGLASLAELTVEGRPRTFEVPPIRHPLEVNLGDQVELLGYDLDATELKVGGT